jgi:hypothetical protein
VGNEQDGILGSGPTSGYLDAHGPRAMGRGMNTSNIPRPFTLTLIIAPLTIAACGGTIETGSSGGEDRDSGSLDAVGCRGSSCRPENDSDSMDVSEHEHDSGRSEVGPPPDTGGADCVLTSYMCVAGGLPSPCWYCPPLLFENCPALTGTCNEMMGYEQCLVCDHRVITEYQCEGSPPRWKVMAQPAFMTCSE